MQEPKNLNPASPQSCMKGMDNLGQTCFFNAAVQCILFSPNSTNYFLKCAPDLNPKRKGASTVSQAFVDLARSYWNSGAQGEVADVRPVYDAFCKATRSFKPGQQHDAHEAMVCMLDKLHEGLSRLKPGDLGVAKDPSICGAEWTSSLKQECSIVSEVFRGQIRVTVQGEGYTSVTYDHFTTLSLAVNEASALSIGGEFVGPACRHVLWMSMMRHGHLRCRQGICVAYTCILHGEIPDRACPFSELGAFGPFVFTETEVRAPPLHATRHTLTMQKNVGRPHDAATASGTQSRQGQTPPVQSTHPCQCARTGQSACQTCAYPIQTPDDQVNLTDHLYPDWRRALRAASHACRMFIGAVGSFRAFLNFR